MLSGKRNFSMDDLITAAFDNQQPEFEVLISTLLKAHEELPPQIRCASSGLRRWRS